MSEIPMTTAEVSDKINHKRYPKTVTKVNGAAGSGAIAEAMSAEATKKELIDPLRYSWYVDDGEKTIFLQNVTWHVYGDKTEFRSGGSVVAVFYSPKWVIRSDVYKG